MSFIVIEGPDGTGKSTQFNLLKEKLEQNNHTVKQIKFPQYDNLSSGPVREYLNGKYGTAEEVGPYRASVLFAVDRYDASFKIREWLKQGYTVLADRYIASNMAHQGGKIEDAEEREKYFNWLYEFEYDLLKIPKPDLNIVLSLPLNVSQELLDTRKQKKYITSGEQKDIHEKSIEHLQHAIKVYNEISDLDGFKKINCLDGENKLRTKENISDEIFGFVGVVVK